MVGTFGKSGQRVAVETANVRIAPASAADMTNRRRLSQCGLPWRTVSEWLPLIL
jgi:hypothetical protein